MAFSFAVRRHAKNFLAMFFLMGLMDAFILVYYGELDAPSSVSSAVKYIGDALSPLTVLPFPAILYTMLKGLLHPGLKAYRVTMKKRLRVVGYVCQSFGVIALVLVFAMKFTWVVETMYRVKLEDTESILVGPVWRFWTELGLMALVLIAQGMGWELDGGAYGKYLDRQLLKLKLKEEEKAAEAREAAGADVEKAVVELDDGEEMTKA